jgi:hypothetical protein
MSNKDLEQQYQTNASRATSGLAPMSGGSRRRSRAQVAPELVERRLTPIGNEPSTPPAPSRRRSSSQDRPKSKTGENHFFAFSFDDTVFDASYPRGCIFIFTVFST